MKQIKKELSKVAFTYNIINIISLLITIGCYFSLKNELIFIIPCVAILSSVIFSLVPLLEKNVNLLRINYKTYQKVNMSVSILFCIIQVAMLCLMLSVGFNANIMICVALGILMMCLGNVLPKMKNGSLIASLFPSIKGKYQAWRRFVRIAGFALFLEGLIFIIMGGLYSSYWTYLYLAILDVIVIIFLYLLALVLGKKYQLENKENEVED